MDVAMMTGVFAYDPAGRQTRSAMLADASSAIEASDVNVRFDRAVDLEYDADGRLHRRTTYNNKSASPLETATTYDDLSEGRHGL